MNAIDPKQPPATDSGHDDAPPVPANSGFSMKRLIPLAVGFALFFVFDLGSYVTFEALNENRVLLMDFVEKQGVRTILAFIAIYAVSTALSLPGGAVLTVTGGFLFGTGLERCTR